MTCAFFIFAFAPNPAKCGEREKAMLSTNMVFQVVVVAIVMRELDSHRLRTFMFGPKENIPNT